MLAHDLIAGRDLGDLDDPTVRKLIHLVGMWWAQAGRFNVLPLDDRFAQRLLGRGDLYQTRQQVTFYPGAVRIPETNAPETKNRSWTMTAHVDVPDRWRYRRPALRHGGDTNGSSLYVKDGRPNYVYNLAGTQLTYLRGQEPLSAGKHRIGYEFEKTGDGPGAGGTGRLYVDDEQVAEAEIPAPPPSATRSTRPSTSAATKAHPSPTNTNPSRRSPARSKRSTSTSSPTSITTAALTPRRRSRPRCCGNSRLCSPATEKVDYPHARSRFVTERRHDTCAPPGRTGSSRLPGSPA